MDANKLTSSHVSEYATLCRKQNDAEQKMIKRHHYELTTEGLSPNLKDRHNKEFQELKAFHFQERNEMSQRHDKEYQNYRNAQLQKKLEQEKIINFKQAVADSLNYADELEADAIKREKDKEAKIHAQIVQEVEEETKEEKKQSKLQELLQRFNSSKDKNVDNDKDR